MKIYLDRIDRDKDGNLIATFEVDGETVCFEKEQMPAGFAETLIKNAIVECEIIDGTIVNPVLLHEETKKKEEEMKNRLHKLFKKDK